MTALASRESLGLGVAGTALNALEKRRQACGYSQDALAFAAGLSSRAYRYMLAGRSHPKPDTLKRLQRALDQLAGVPSAPDGMRVKLILATWGGFLAQVAPHFGVTSDDCHARGGAFRSFDKKTHAASRARNAAMYLTSIALDLRQHELAKAFNVSRAAVCLALRQVEDAREDAGFDAMMMKAQRAVTGRDE
jgi:DNA-binding XRE family transcriptional regulator